MKNLCISPQGGIEELIVSAAVCEGRDPGVIDALARTIEQFQELTLINVDPNRHLNQCFFLYCGPVESLLKGTIQLLQVAISRIDLSQFEGESNPLGAVDHLSLIPLRAGLLPQAVECVRQFAARVHQTLGLPIYLFAENARNSQRRDIRVFRRLSYMDVQDLPPDHDLPPDLYRPGAPAPHGALIMGARLYQVNIAFCFDLEFAEEVRAIAQLEPQILPGWDLLQRKFGRERLRPFAREKVSEILCHAHFVIDDISRSALVRVLCNIPDYRKLPLPIVSEIMQYAAEEYGIPLVGTQLLGYLPAEVLIAAGEFLVDITRVAEYEPLRLMSYAVDYLNLDAIDPFVIDKRVLDYFCPVKR